MAPSCRVCSETGGELLSPCLCSGSVQFVHRECLNRWRSTSSRAFQTCEICEYNYVIQITNVSQRAVSCCGCLRFSHSTCYFLLKCATDVLALTIFTFVSVLMPAYFVFAAVTFTHRAHFEDFKDQHGWVVVCAMLWFSGLAILCEIVSIVSVCRTLSFVVGTGHLSEDIFMVISGVIFGVVIGLCLILGCVFDLLRERVAFHYDQSLLSISGVDTHVVQNRATVSNSVDDNV